MPIPQSMPAWDSVTGDGTSLDEVVKSSRWLIPRFSHSTPKPAGTWPMTATSGSSSAGTGRREPARPRLAATPVTGRVSFVGSSKRVLRRVLGEAGVVLTPEAQARFDALPEQFLDFVVAPKRFVVQWAEAA